ncbi:MAG TPA: HlyD family efflux transporter periplasmic adaptor subunit, partial [Microlunatus sp.]|nr:HlyD family efflux transporter periplasmic adaptor subunit [Microlunatus sp.]
LMARSNQVTGQLATLRAQLAQLPPQPPGSPPSPATAQLAAAIAQLEQARLRLRTGLGALRQADAQLQTGTRRLRTGIAKLRSAVPKLDNGLAQARSQQKKLHSARTKIIDARAELRRTRRLAVVAADAARVGVDVALNQVRLATITSPTVGTVVDVATVGQVVAPGAGLVTIREDADPTVTSWLAPDQLNRVCLGAAAAVSADWMSSGPVARVAPVEGTVTRIGQRADYPPTSFATDQVHLTRAVPVTITVPPSSGRALPPGVPVDLSIRPAAGGCFAPAATVPSSRVGLSDRQLPPERGHPSGQTIATNSR